MKAQSGQSIFDIVLQEFGTLESLFIFLDDNNLSLNDRINASQELTANSVNVGDENIKDFVTLKNITMNNSQGLTTPPLLGGDYNSAYNNDYY